MAKRADATPGLSKTSEPGIRKYSGPLGTTYRVRVTSTDPATGERAYIQDSFPTLAQARDFKRRTQHELREGIYQEPSREPVSAIIQHWLETARLAENSRRAYERAKRLVIDPAIGSIAVSRLTGRMVQDLYNEPRGRSAAMHVQATLNGALELAVHEGVISRNPAAGLRTPHRDVDASPEPVIWTIDELTTFLDATKGHPLHDLYHVAAHTGLRLSELINLTWDDITLDLARLFVARSKSSSGVRRVALDAVTVARLRRLRARQDAQRIDWGDAWQEHGRVFDRGDGRPVSPRTVEAHMARIVERLGLPAATPHSLRHFHSAALLREGVPLNVVQRRLGHADASTTATIYGRVLPDDERSAAAVFQDLMDHRAEHNRNTMDDEPEKTASESSS